MGFTPKLQYEQTQMKRARHSSQTRSPALAWWKCVAAVAAERRDARVWMNVTVAVGAIGRTASAHTASAQRDEYQYWLRCFDTLYTDYILKQWSTRWVGTPRLHNAGQHEWLYDDQMYRVEITRDLYDEMVQRSWYRNDVLHRDGAPAMERWGRACHLYFDSDSDSHEHAYKRFEYYQNGRRHRLDGPAVTKMHWCFDEKHAAHARYKEGVVVKEEWYLHGERHRDGAPAVQDGETRMWYQHGQLHRDGRLPAVQHGNGHKECWHNGTFIGQL